MLNVEEPVKKLKVENLKGTWLMIKTGDDYCPPEFIEFENDQILHFKLDQKNENRLSKKKCEWREKLTESKYEFVNDRRLRIFRLGKTHTIISENESITEDTEFATDYERIIPTKTELKKEEIEKLEFKAQWNNEKIAIVFNKNLNSPVTQEVNKRLNREGRKMVLENLQGTYFASIYYNGEREILIGIKEVDEVKAVLFGFSEKPYEISAE